MQYSFAIGTTRQEKLREYNRVYRLSHPEKVKESQIRFREAHPNKIVEYARRTRQKYKAQMREYNREWWKKNVEKQRAKTARRRARKKNAMPKWLSPSDYGKIGGFYRRARSLERKTGIPHQVDHIIPLRGKNICGLHVPWNLQILTKEENQTKSNTIHESLDRRL